MRPGLMNKLEELLDQEAERGAKVPYPDTETDKTAHYSKGQDAAPAGIQAMCGKAYSDDELLKELFNYHAPTQWKQKQYETVRDAALHLGRVILKNTPHGADRTAAIRHLREAVMTANGGIALDGLSL